MATHTHTRARVLAAPSFAAVSVTVFSRSQSIPRVVVNPDLIPGIPPGTLALRVQGGIAERTEVGVTFEVNIQF